MKVREGGRVVNNHVLVATGVNADGHREILGLEVPFNAVGLGGESVPQGVTRPLIREAARDELAEVGSGHRPA
jgi:hypothetical protein